jgi:hypothetical protein
MGNVGTIIEVIGLIIALGFAVYLFYLIETEDLREVRRDEKNKLLAQKESREKQIHLDKNAEEIANIIKEQISSQKPIENILLKINTKRYEYEAIAKAISSLNFLKEAERGRLLNNIDTDTISQILNYLSDSEKITILQQIDPRKREDILMRFPLSKRSRLRKDSNDQNTRAPKGNAFDAKLCEHNTQTIKPIKSKQLYRQISKTQFFVEPPVGFMGLNFDITGLPKNFIQSADRELNLAGELIDYMKNHTSESNETLDLNVLPAIMSEVKKIARIPDNQRESFFQTKSQSELWELYYASGQSGARYTILVEFGTRSSNELKNGDLRRQIHSEYEELYMKESIQYILTNPKASTEEVVNFAMSKASHAVMVRYGVPMSEMLSIIVEGLTDPDA